MIVISRSNFCNVLIASSFLSVTEREESSKLLPAAQFVRTEVKESIHQNPMMAGSILRLAFHDAVVRSKTSNPYIGGADGSIRYELDWSENRGLSKPLKEVEKIYNAQYDKYSNCQNNENENIDCPMILSFADVLALAGAAAVEAAQGSKVPIKLGRMDKMVADERFLDQKIESETDRLSIQNSLPSPALDSLGLRNFFTRLGLTEEEMVALMGAHDLGRHVTLTGMPKECLRNLTRTCLEDAPVLAPFIAKDPDTFSNTYFDTLLRWNERQIEYREAAFIPTDVAMVVDGGLKKSVVKFARDKKLFFQGFTTAYQKLVDSTATTSLRY